MKEEKKFIEPQVEIITFFDIDVLTTSTGEQVGDDINEGDVV